jgi:hypothetical protein
VQNTIGAIQHTAYGGGSTKVSIKICASAARVTGLSGEPGGSSRLSREPSHSGVQRLQGVASHGGGVYILKGFSSGAKKRPVMLSRPSRVARKKRPVMLSRPSRVALRMVGGDPRGAAVLRVLRGAEALQGFPTLMHFAMPLLFAASQPFCSLRRRCAICSSLR